MVIGRRVRQVIALALTPHRAGDIQPRRKQKDLGSMGIEPTLDPRALIVGDWDRSGESRRAMNLRIESEVLTRRAQDIRSIGYPKGLKLLVNFVRCGLMFNPEQSANNKPAVHQLVNGSRRSAQRPEESAVHHTADFSSQSANQT